MKLLAANAGQRAFANEVGDYVAGRLPNGAS
jgi:hypothetical protein